MLENGCGEDAARCMPVTLAGGEVACEVENGFCQGLLLLQSLDLADVAKIE